MRLHANALLGPKGREVMVLRVLEQGWSLTEAAEAAGVSDRTCSKWIARYRAEGQLGLIDRPSTPRHVPHRTPEDRVELIASLRRLRMTGAETLTRSGAEIRVAEDRVSDSSGRAPSSSDPPKLMPTACRGMARALAPHASSAAAIESLPAPSRSSVSFPRPCPSRSKVKTSSRWAVSASIIPGREKSASFPAPCTIRTPPRAPPRGTNRCPRVSPAATARG